jgi:response regulator RpfG family c-di-GMP phosphodiesterase
MCVFEHKIILLSYLSRFIWVKDTMDKEFIPLLYICDSKANVDLAQFSKTNGFILHQCSELAHVLKHAKLRQPDLIIIDLDIKRIENLESQIIELFKIRFNFKPALFMVLSQYPESEKRLKLLQSGVDDFIVKPVLIDEVKEKFQVHYQLKDLKQKIDTQDMNAKKSFEYLEKFKVELKQTKSELYEERTTLNNALKQINQMTQERIRLKKDKKNLSKTLLDNMEGFADILSNLIKTRIEKNRGHGERVAHIANFLGKLFKFDEKKLDELEKAAMLHEVGLLFFTNETLQKAKNELIEYEKDLFMQYPVKGADLLLNCTEFDKSEQIIRHLNENSDGTGWPKGMKKRFIPLSSRILAGADVFDTLKDDKAVKSLEVFLEKLEKFSGSRLDPVIVAGLEKYAVLHMGSDSYRVKGIGIHQLESGMTLGTALFTNTGTKLFSVNTLLTPDAIDKIKKYNREYPVDETVYIRA